MESPGRLTRRSGGSRKDLQASRGYDTGLVLFVSALVLILVCLLLSSLFASSHGHATDHQLHFEILRVAHVMFHVSLDTL